VVVALLVGCESPAPELGDERELLTRVRGDAYESWTRAPGWEELQASNVQHGAFTEVFLNEIVVEALTADPKSQTTWPLGSIIVMDGWYDEERAERATLAIMEKRAEGWYFEEYTGAVAEDAVPRFGGQHPDPDLCVGCHAAGDDYVRAFDLP
jgi:hypothetical protein